MAGLADIYIYALVEKVDELNFNEPFMQTKKRPLHKMYVYFNYLYTTNAWPLEYTKPLEKESSGKLIKIRYVQ